MNVNYQTSIPAIHPVASHVDGFSRISAHAKDLGLRTREALVRMRERMENLELSLCQVAAENQELNATLSGINEKLVLTQASNYLAKKSLEEKAQAVVDLEAQLAAYRRKAKADEAEIEALKTQLFA